MYDSCESLYSMKFYSHHLNFIPHTLCFHSLFLTQGTTTQVICHVYNADYGKVMPSVCVSGSSVPVCQCDELSVNHSQS